MGNRDNVRDRHLERQGRAIGRSGEWFALIGAILAIPGVLLVALADSWAYGVGWALLGLAAGPLVIGAALLLSGLISRWSARHRSFA